MSSRFVLSLLALVATGLCSYAQVAGGSSIAKPEFDKAVAEFEAQQKAIDDEIEPALKDLREKYRSDLEALASKLTQAKRPEEGDQVKAEIKRFDEHGIDSEPFKTVPAEVRTLWAAFLRNMVPVQQKVAIKRSAISSKFSQVLTALDQGYRASKDVEGLGMVKRARTALALRGAIENNRLAATEIAGRVDKPWQDVAREGGYLVGAKTSSGGWFQFKVLGGLTPVFATARGTRDGKTRAGRAGAEVLAKDGYAVGGLMVRSGEVVNAIQLIFMRINSDGMTLNPQDFYVSDWLGGEGGGKPREISARGKMVVGLTGSTESTVQSLGLIYVK